MWPNAKRATLAPAAAHATPQSTWLDWWLAWRDRLLADGRVQRWAARFPITRKISQRRAQALFDLCAGFVYSQVLRACVQLRVFDILFERPHTSVELSRRLSLSVDATVRLLNAAAALRLLERRRDGRFGLSVLGAALVGNPAIATMVEHHSLLYRDLRDPVSLLRGRRSEKTALAGYWPYAGAERPAALSSEQVADYSALMSASQPLIASDVLDVCPLDGRRCLLDIGGGEGAFLVAAAARSPTMRLVLFDLPAVAERARNQLAQARLAHRTTVVGGDFFTDPLPYGADLVTLVRVVHDHGDAAVLALLRNIRRVLPEDGVLLIAEPMSATAGTDVVGDAYFGFYLLAMGSGRVRSPDELKRLLKAAGFGRTKLLATRRPLLTNALLAWPKA
jgi:demethylspheroidene O-methyltransferase